MMSHGAGNFMRASLLLLHIVCGGFEWLECPRGWGFENRNLQIPTFAPSVGPGLEWETIDRCINYSSRGQSNTWENLLTLPRLSSIYKRSAQVN